MPHIRKKSYETESYLLWSCKQLERAVIFRIEEAHKNKLDKQDLLPSFWKHLQPKTNDAVKYDFL